MGGLCILVGSEGPLKLAPVPSMNSVLGRVLIPNGKRVYPVWMLTELQRYIGQLTCWSRETSAIRKLITIPFMFPLSVFILLS